MTWRLRRSEQASRDLSELWLYIAEDNEAAAETLLDKIDDVFRKTADFPRIGRSIDDVLPDHRVLTYGNYLIIYCVRDADRTCEMIRVLHGTRQWTDLIG